MSHYFCCYDKIGITQNINISDNSFFFLLLFPPVYSGPSIRKKKKRDVNAKAKGNKHNRFPQFQFADHIS